MKQLNQLKESTLLSGVINIRLLLSEGDSDAYPSGSILNIMINVKESPVLAYSESVNEAFYYLTETLHVAQTFDELIKLFNDDDYVFSVSKDTVLPTHTLRDEIIERENSLYETDKVKLDEIENITIGDLVKVSTDYKHLYDILFEAAEEVHVDGERFNYKLVWDEETQEYIVK